MNLKLGVFGILVLLFYSCFQFKKVDTSVNSIKKPVLPNDLYFITDCDSIRKGSAFTYMYSRFQVNTFSDFTKVYCSPIENSEIIDSVPFNSAIRGKLIILNNGTSWLEVYINSKLGYIKRDNIAKKEIHEHYISASLGYDFSNRKNQVKSYSPLSEHVIQSSLIFDSIYEIEELLRLKYVNFSGRKSVFKYHTYNESYPEKSVSQFFFINLNSYQIVNIGSIQSKEGVSNNHIIYVESLYFPCVFQNNDTLLVKNGDVENIFNKKTASLNVISVHDSINKFNLIIKEIKEGIHQLDEEGTPMYDDVADEIYTYTTRFEYYRWKNNKMVRIK